MSLISFRMYALISSLLTIFTFTHAYYTRHHFYPVVLYLTTHKPSLVVLANLFFLSLVTFGITIKSTFLSQLNRDEVEELIQLSKYAITETCLALTIFREELSMKLVAMFTLLLFSKQFHWLSQMRVEHVARSNQLPLFTHIRLAALLLLLLVLDCACVSALVIHFTQTKQASVLILFLFESLILTLYTITVSIRYLLTLIDFAYENRWANKSIFTFYLDFTSDFIRLLTYLAFFAIICTYYGLPLHLIRELCVTFYNLRERIVKFIAYRRLTANMNERFADATREELESGDRTCIVCREDMIFTTDSDGARVKKLACSHLFHFACLRTWLERSQSCPTCRADIPMTPATSMATAANPAADPILPPLPPHLQAHLDALNARQQQQQQQQQQQSPTQVLSQAPPARSLSASPSSLSYTQSSTTSATPAAPLTHTHEHIHRPHPSARINFSQLFGSDNATRTEEKSNANPIRSFSPILSSPLPPLSPSPPPSSHPSQMAASYPHPMMMMPHHQQWHPHAQNAFSAAAFPHFHANATGAMPAAATLNTPNLSVHLGSMSATDPSIASAATPSSPMSDEGMKALQAAMYAHQTLLLQHRMEFLQSELKQARIAYEMIINKQMELTDNKSAHDEKKTNDSKQDDEQVTAAVDADDDDDIDSRSSTSQSSGLTHRHTARPAVST